MRDKYKEEIEEILSKAGETPSNNSTREPAHQTRPRPWETKVTKQSHSQGFPRGLRRGTVTPGKLMLAGLVLFLVGLAIRPLIWLGLITFVAAYLLYFLKPRAIRQEKRWRGRSVEEEETSTLEWLKRWFKG